MNSAPPPIYRQHAHQVINAINAICLYIGAVLTNNANTNNMADPNPNPNPTSNHVCIPLIYQRYGQSLTFKQFGMPLNVIKTKVIVFRENSENVEVRLNGCLIENVNSYQVFGCNTWSAAKFWNAGGLCSRKSKESCGQGLYSD